MKNWYAKELSVLTNISVRTLHHYDKIGLLKPRLRESNGYRLYSEKDLLRLQQIIALKFFGFKLSQIKLLLSKQDGIKENFTLQSMFLEEKSKTLMEASKILKSVANSRSSNKSIPWDQIIKLIEVYHMTQQLEHSWVKEIFTPDELKLYAQFEKELKLSEQKAFFEKKWQDLKEELKSNLNHDPSSQIGIDFGKKYMEWVNSIYGKKYAHLRTKKWEQGFGEGKGLDDIGVTKEQMAWVEKATNAYWKDRVYGFLNKMESLPSTTALKLWNEILDDLYGNEVERKTKIYEILEKDEKLSATVKSWLRDVSR